MSAADPVALAEFEQRTEPKAAHVIEALCRVMRDLPGIGKNQQASQQQGGYHYRGIEAITSHTQALFARHGVVFAPRVVGYEIRDITVAGKPWTDVVEQVEYDVYGPGGPADKITVGPIIAIGRDNSDKGGNKCLTQAYKYALIQALNIGDGKDDADGTSYEADAPRPPRPKASEEDRKALEDRIAALDPEARRSLGAAWKQPDEDGAILHKLAELFADELERATALVVEAENNSDPARAEADTEVEG